MACQCDRAESLLSQVESTHLYIYIERERERMQRVPEPILGLEEKEEAKKGERADRSDIRTSRRHYRGDVQSGRILNGTLRDTQGHSSHLVRGSHSRTLGDTLGHSRVSWSVLDCP